MGRTLRKGTGTVPKSRKPKKTRGLPPQQQHSKEADESTYKCEICTVNDNEDLVCCDVCHLWYHFKCVNVTSDVSTHYWACTICEEKYLAKSTPNNPEEVVFNPAMVSNENQNNQPGAVSQPIDGMLIQLTPDNINQPIPQTTENNPAQPRTTRSTSSAVSRRTALALQRLEEEKRLHEKREEKSRRWESEYLDEKYRILEQDSEADLSEDDEELATFKRDRVDQWTDGVQKERQTINLVEGIAENRRLHRTTSSTIQKAKAGDMSLPSWLTAPSNPTLNSFVWKTLTGSSTTTVASTLCTSTTTSTVNNLSSPSKRNSGVPGQKSNVKSDNLVSFGGHPQSIFKDPMRAPRSEVPELISSNQNILNRQSTTSSFNATVLNVPQKSSTASNIHPATSTKSTFFRIAQPTQPSSSVTNNPSMTGYSQQPFLFSSANNQPIMSNNQPFQIRPNQTASRTFSSISNQPLSFGQHSIPTNNIFQSNFGQSSIFDNANQSQASFNPTFPTSQTTHHALSDINQGVSTVNINNVPLMTTGQSYSSGPSLHTNTPPYSSNNSFGHGQTNYGFRSGQNNNVNQNGTMENLASGGQMLLNMNDSMAPIHRTRLTAEQIAARHVIPKLPQFFGDPKYWQAFISSFEYATEACGFTNVENLGRLQESLKGDAREVVGSRLLHPNSVPGVISTLRMMYGRSELIIESMIESIKKEPSPKEDDLASLIKFAISVQNLCGSIQETGALEHLRNPTLMNVITDKLPTQIQLNWAYHRHSIRVVDLSTLGSWLYDLADIASQVVRRPNTKSGKKKESEKTNVVANNSNSFNNLNKNNYVNTQVENKSKQQDTAEGKRSSKCLACKSEACSRISTCKKFKQWERSEKWEFLKEHKLCSRCLGGHSFYRCKSNQSCKIEGCTKKHHTLLHDHGKSTESSNEVKKSSVPESKPTGTDVKIQTSVCNSQRSIHNRTDIFRIVPVVLYHNKNIIRDFAYLDDGSNLTLMENKLADELGLVGTPQAVCIDWAFGQSHESDESRIVTTKISGFYHQAPSYKLENVRTVNDLRLPTQSLTSTWLEQYSHLKNIPIATYEAVKPRMLIGLQYSKLTVSLETVEGSWEEPIVCRTRLGWVVQGPSYDDETLQKQKNVSLNICECQSNDIKLHQLVKEYFSIENFGVKLCDKYLESKAIQRARQILESTTVKRNGRYESGLLWKYDQIELPNSYNMAFRRLQCLESKMTRNPHLKENLRTQIKQFLEKGYIRKLSPNELKTKHERVWYLPIFPVFNPKKPDKVRIVWDAAAKVKNVSLNSMLLTGPDLLVPLVDILRRFRERLIAVLGDIKEMYHQIAIIPKDQQVQRFIWRDGDTTKEPDVYVMQVSTFGAACSPCTAQFVKNKNANEYAQSYPQAAAAIIENTYVDDLLECVHELNDAVKLVGDIKYVNQQGGFDTRNFLSNSKQLLEKIGEHTNQTSKNMNMNTDLILGTERVLGMFWDTETDNFTYSLKYTRVNENILTGTHIPTKREVLRILMSIFDPLGLLANFLVYAKILLQETWRCNIEWDEPITDTLQTRWVKWITALKNVENIQIPRLYSPKLSPGTPDSIQLHVFVDASVEAFAAAAYLRIKDADGVDCCLIGAKTKVAPNKLMSVPRLELQAGVLGTRLSGSIKISQRLNIDKVVYWSDSKTVMGWINSEARRYHQFVAFRIGEILESSDSKEWRWVPSEHNVADEATKSKEVQKLESSSRWFKGPNFLYDDEETWFTEENCNEHNTEEEMRPGFVMACREVQKVSIVNVKRFSQWNRLVHAMTYVFRFIHNLKAVKRRTGPLLQEEIAKGENYLYRIAQRDHYLDEIATLERNAKVEVNQQKYLEKASELYKCSPYLDDHGILRIKGRADAAKCLSQETKRPIILPRRHYITKLIVNHYHRRFLHINHQSALNEINQRYDIPALRVVMKSVRNSCQRCKNNSAVPQIPEMAELPFARLAAYERPYTFVGIDYFGPFKVKITRNCSVPRWGVIYTCLTTRAIHLEVAHLLSTNSCIMAFERFGTNCGFPREVFSDNGTNFHGMDNELKEEFKKLDQDEIQRTFTNSEMKWSFNPPLSPHMGGAWERLIRTVKSCFKQIVTTRNPTDETLPTLFAQVENIVNSRPLTYVSLDSAEDEALTPNHFLFGSSNGRKPLCNTSPKDLNKNDWRNIQEQTNQFWKRFVLEYMPTLTKRTKWFKQSKAVEVGDVVLIIDETNPRNTWPKGIVEETFVGKGGKRRQAMVRAILETKNGPIHKLYKRSVHKLAVLDVKVPANEEVKRQPVESINGGEIVGQH